jgi:hypothetical protein
MLLPVGLYTVMYTCHQSLILKNDIFCCTDADGSIWTVIIGTYLRMFTYHLFLPINLRENIPNMTKLWQKIYRALMEHGDVISNCDDGHKQEENIISID